MFKRPMFLGFSLVVACAASGCGDTSKHESVIKDMIQGFNELADALESVKDPASAKVAAAKINKLCDRFDEITKRAETLPKVTKGQQEALEKKFKADADKAGMRILAVGNQAGLNSGGEPDFLSAANRLQQSMLKLQQAAMK